MSSETVWLGLINVLVALVIAWDLELTRNLRRFSKAWWVIALGLVTILSLLELLELTSD